MFTRCRLSASGLLVLCVCLLLTASGLAETDVGGKPAQRIISLAPNLTEMLFAIGAGGQIVGVMQHSDFPPAAQNIPRVGDFSRIDYEQVLALQPDLILAWQTGNAQADIEHLRALGLRVVETEPSTLTALANLFLTLGELTGHVREAEVQHRDFTARLEGLRSRYSHVKPLAVFYQFWADPIMTVNGDHIVSDVLSLCGGYNLFADLAVIAGPITVESVLQRNPDVILASGIGDERPAWLDEWRRWTELTAIKQDKLYVVSPDLLLRQSPRLLQGAEQVCAHLESARQH